MENLTLFENTTLVRESINRDIEALLEKKKKKSWDKEILFVIVFVLTALVLFGVLSWVGVFDTEDGPAGVTQRQIGGTPAIAVLLASGAVAFLSALLYAIKNREPKKAPEDTVKTVSYRYIIADEGIKAEHGYRTDNISYEDIKKITSNGHSYFIYTENKKYQICINGFGSKINAFERFISNRGFTIEIEP